MKLVIQGKNIEITDAIREYVHQKIEKAVNHFQNLTMEVDVHLSVARNPRINPKQSAEVTIYANGTIIRAEESSENLYASIDLVADKIARQLRKYKEKRNNHKGQPSARVETGTANASFSVKTLRNCAGQGDRRRHKLHFKHRLKGRLNRLLNLA